MTRLKDLTGQKFGKLTVRTMKDAEKTDITLRYIGITQDNITQAYNDLTFKPKDAPCCESQKIDSDVKQAVFVLKNYLLSSNNRCNFFVKNLFSMIESEEV